MYVMFEYTYTFVNLPLNYRIDSIKRKQTESSNPDMNLTLTFLDMAIEHFQILMHFAVSRMANKAIYVMTKTCFRPSLSI
jgi:hypothetical protein